MNFSELVHPRGCSLDPNLQIKNENLNLQQEMKNFVKVEEDWKDHNLIFDVSNILSDHDYFFKDVSLEIEVKDEKVEFNDAAPYTCNKCNVTYDGEASYETHMEMEHSSSDRNDVCTRRVECERALTDKSDQGTPDDCEIPNEFNTETSPLEKYGTKTVLKSSNKNSDEKFIKCDNCDYKCSRRRYLVRHKKLHGTKEPFRCVMCRYSFDCESKLATHMTIHSNRPFECKDCKYRFTHKRNLISHMKTHAGRKPFKCSYCDYRSVRKSHMIQHEITHNGKKPYKCEICDIKYIQKSQLMSHMKIHMFLKSFFCHSCGFLCTLKRNLISHMKTHVEKPFKCTSCKYRCVEKCSLVNHRRIHSQEGPFKCDNCPYKSQEKCDMKEHVRHSRYFLKGTLIQHMKNVVKNLLNIENITDKSLNE